MEESTNKGFTIIEFLVYIAILAIVVNVMGGVALNVFRVGSRTDTIQEVAHNGRFAMQRMGQAIKSAKAVISPEKEGSFLALEFEEADKNPTIFDVSGKTLRIKEGNKEYVDLTSSEVNIDRVMFQKVSSIGIDSVKIEMNISFYNPEGLPEYGFDNFFTGAFTIRNK
jgi:prepilin-type N-terminal cleavage/methylation domain-containing protein